MPSISSKNVIRDLRSDGWYKVAQKGSHMQFKHPTKSGRVTLVHPKRDLPQATAESVYRQARLKPPWKA